MLLIMLYLIEYIVGKEISAWMYTYAFFTDLYLYAYIVMRQTSKLGLEEMKIKKSLKTE
jgi:hypothetical protein